MDRLRCGVIFTDAFATHLQRWWTAENERHVAMVPSIEFVHCREGDRAGESWMTYAWRPRKSLPDHELFDVGPITLHLSRRSQKALKWRCLDALDGQVIVRGG